MQDDGEHKGQGASQREKTQHQDLAESQLHREKMRFSKNNFDYT